MFSYNRNLLTGVLSATLLLALAACSAPATATPSADGAAAPTASATPTPILSGVDALPLLEGLADAAPADWVTGSCDGLDFAGPAGWTRMEQPTGETMFQNDGEYSLEATVDGQLNYLTQAVTFGCNNPKTEWAGEWTSDAGAESFRLDVDGAAYAAVLAYPLVDYLAEGGDLPGNFFRAEIQIVTPEQDYYTVFFTLPANDNAYALVAQVASGLSVG